MTATDVVGPKAQHWGLLWGSRAEEWALTEEQQLPTYEAALDRVGIGADQRVLEVGCGSGVFLRAAADRGAAVTGVDSSGRLVELARRRAPEAELMVGDLQALPFDDDSFDVVFASNLLEHLERPAATALLAGARRVLRPGGRLVLVQPNFRLDPGRYFDDFTHVAIYTDRSLHDYLVSEGWEVTHLEPRFLPLTMKSRAAALSFLVPLYLRSPIRPLAGQMLVVAEPAPGPGGA